MEPNGKWEVTMNARAEIKVKSSANRNARKSTSLCTTRQSVSGYCALGISEELTTRRIPVVHCQIRTRGTERTNKKSARTSSQICTVARSKANGSMCVRIGDCAPGCAVFAEIVRRWIETWYLYLHNGQERVSNLQGMNQ